MDVIPLILSEELAREIPLDYLAKLAECSTSIVKGKVKDYLNSPNAADDVKAIVKAAYSEQIAIEEFLSSKDISEKVELIKDLDYVNISTHQSVERLQEYKEAITAILSNDYAVPYIAPIRGVLIKDLREEISVFAKATSNQYLKSFESKLKKHSSLFRDSQYETYKGTVVKKIIRNRTKYEIILKGIDFILDKKMNNTNPQSWRYL